MVKKAKNCKCNDIKGKMPFAHRLESLARRARISMIGYQMKVLHRRVKVTKSKAAVYELGTQLLNLGAIWENLMEKEYGNASSANKA